MQSFGVWDVTFGAEGESLRCNLVIRADVHRRWSFNVTLLIAGIFGLSSGGSPNFLTLAPLLAVLGVGVGGNLPVDSAVFLGKNFILRSTRRY